ncbi:RHS repeat domain-containing protein, partial [Pseudomonas jessenii]|uniref:RHS repeat domain-containing protein n=1 Tax=Pseudomonas jessenii TaxID=77298 RepID=UPI0015E8A4D2
NTSQFDHVKDNRLKRWRDQEYAYDAWGNLIEKRSGMGTLQTFGYDCENRLVRAETLVNGKLESTGAYRYDSLGRRVAKVSEVNGKIEQKHFLWQGLRMLREERPGQSSLYLYEPGSYAPLARVDQAEGEEQQLYYFHTDQIGTPLEMTDREGQIVWQATYKAWGAVERLHVNEVEQNLRFQGQYFDDETGLHYNTFRYYDPEVGRFVTQDPIGLLGSFNLYEYVKNPVLWSDPWGLCADKDWGAYYASKTGTRPPSSMVKPHAHHIVFKGSFARSPGMQKALERSRAVLDKYKIDAVNDPAAMMWAENQGHTIANARLVASKLEAADTAVMARDLPFKDAVSVMKSELQKIGAEIFGS